jgi:uncharacterized membrane protein
MKMNKTIKLTGILIGMIIFLSANMLAFAVSSQYWEENPLTMSPGESKEIKIVLQNMAGSENITTKGSISEGSEIAKIINAEDAYSVPAGQKIQINIKVDIPEDAKITDQYNIKLTFTALVEQESGAFSFGSSVKRQIPVNIIEKVQIEEESEVIKIP